LGKALTSGALDYLEKASALKNRGVARWRLKRFQAAVRDFNAAVKITPGDPTLYNNRGNALLSLGMNDEATETFNNRGNAHFKAGDYRAAFRDFSKAVELRADMAEPFNGRGKTQLALGRRLALCATSSAPPRLMPPTRSHTPIGPKRRWRCGATTTVSRRPSRIQSSRLAEWDS
jgi:Flp pilus assembly protein TadD